MKPDSGGYVSQPTSDVMSACMIKTDEGERNDDDSRAYVGAAGEGAQEEYENLQYSD